MAIKPNKTLSKFSELLIWLQNLKGLGSNDLWLQPIAEGKWSIREILTHMMNWDKNSHEMMVPNFTEGANLFFVEIEEHNKVAAAWAAHYTDLNMLITDVARTRQQLLDLLNKQYNDSIKFKIDNQNYTYKKFVDVFIHHDEHHIKQIETFLKQHNIG